MKTIIYKTLFVLSIIFLIGCNTNDDSLIESDSIVGSWKLNERIITYIQLLDPVTGGFMVDSLYDFNGIHTLTIDTGGNVILFEETATYTSIDTGEVVILDTGYMVDFGEPDMSCTVDLINTTSIQMERSIVFPVCGGINFKDTYIKVGN